VHIPARLGMRTSSQPSMSSSLWTMLWRPSPCPRAGRVISYLWESDFTMWRARRALRFAQSDLFLGPICWLVKVLAVVVMRALVSFAVGYIETMIPPHL
jgi:hypothetical protein